MTTLTSTSLDEVLTALALTAPLPSSTFPLASPLSRPLDIARIYLAEILQSLVGTECTTDQAWSSIVWPGDIYSGDLAAVLPKLFGKNKVTGKDGWADIAFSLIEKVFTFCQM